VTAGRGPGSRARRSAFPLCAALAACLLGACSFNPPLDLAAVLPGQPSLRLQSVPFYPQLDYQCGPAALAGVLAAAGVATDPVALAPQVYLPGRQGSLQLELLAATRRAGRIPYLVEGEPGALLAQLRGGRPALVFQNLRTRSFPVWHYAVLVGVDPGANEVYLNSGGEQGLALAAPSFLRTWDWAGRWAFVALRPGELPVQAQPAPYIEAVAAFERVAGSAAAAPSWRAALRRWPLEPAPYLALGNLAYAAGNLPVAIDYYRRGLGHRPRDPALGNNLASVLGELGCPRTATALLEPIQARLPGDSSWHPVLAGTLAELAALAPTDGGFCAALYPG
jgi:tetratricopeptide (TPR) repeat protein